MEISETIRNFVYMLLCFRSALCSIGDHDFETEMWKLILEFMSNVMKLG
jgi:hypothetical protein